MPKKNEQVSGDTAPTSPVALLLIDVINDFQFDDAQRLFRYALPMAKRLAKLKQRARRQGIPVVYVNDNFGKWQSNLHRLVQHCLKDEVRGKPIVQLLKPADEDYFVLKPKHSGFFSTTLDILLRYLHVKTVVLTGLAGNNCVLFTANDAYMRDYQLIVPSDCIASNTKQDNDYALRQMATVLKAQIAPSHDIRFNESPSREGVELRDSADRPLPVRQSVA